MRNQVLLVPPLFLLLLLGLFTRAQADDRSAFARDQQRLTAYRAELVSLRQKGHPSVELPGPLFFLFGMGSRHKFIYRGGELIEWPSLRIVRKWTVNHETIVPPAYAVWLETAGPIVHIYEDEQGVWLTEGPAKSVLSSAPVRLPDFADTRFPNLLRTLHHDILVNIVSGKPVPNFLVYPKPWYRDGAMTAMVLRRTGNIGLIHDWILSLREPFDRNNAGHDEPDNLGEVLYLVSCVSDRHHPIVANVVKSVDRFRRSNFIVGLTDGGEHPVYQTKWLKFGLKSLGLDDPFTVPHVADTYASLFWWDLRDGQIGSEFSVAENRNYPYLAWARDHLAGTHSGPIASTDYPITWELQASEADYKGMAVLGKEWQASATGAPHTWHAAEMFLLLAEPSNPNH